MIEQLETALWQQPEDEQRLQAYQQGFRELGDEAQHRFIIVIPVADRPQHLQACLASTLKLCETFGYGEVRNGVYQKVEVLVADDSREMESIEQHKTIAHSFTEQGLRCHYFGQHEQLAQLDKLDDETRNQLIPVIGDIPAEHFYHKGASIMRNIAYLKLREMVADDAHTLIYFIDSDQEFQVSVATRAGGKTLYAINYLYQLDRLFRDNDITILTGKVVGDPPVSPSVMAGNFLDDIASFLQTIQGINAEGACEFHGEGSQSCDDAAYHDMAELFGFNKRAHSFDYQCTLEGEHDHAACLTDFAYKLGRFFDGEHPTRKSYYEHQPLAESLVPARTIYTGNYCFRAEALRYFIPFATLKLRMAGPVLGRIIKAEIGNKFISANLPMLHKRTVDELGQSEFRPGIKRQETQVDLSGEYERQFFGDVMLFSIARLTDTGYPHEIVEVEDTVRQIEDEMLQKYTTKHREIVVKIRALRQLFEAPGNWWQQGVEVARLNIATFLDNMEGNFGVDAKGFAMINSSAHRAERRQDIIDAILGYRNDRACWQQLLEQEASS